MSLEHAPARQKRLISRREFRSRLGISRTTEWRLAQIDPTFPHLVWVTPAKSGYFDHEADDYIAARPRVRRPA